jgi:VIT1/CCC1 family predicted Fe2+/Mn2+ transporter
MIAAYGPWLLLAAGALRVVLGIDRTLKPRKQESKLLQVVSFLAGALLLAAPIGLVMQAGKGPAVSGVSILLMLALGICLTARVLKSIPLAFIIVAVTGTGLLNLLNR